MIRFHTLRSTHDLRRYTVASHINITFSPLICSSWKPDETTYSNDTLRAKCAKLGGPASATFSSTRSPGLRSWVVCLRVATWVVSP